MVIVARLRQRRPHDVCDGDQIVWWLCWLQEHDWDRAAGPVLAGQQEGLVYGKGWAHGRALGEAGHHVRCFLGFSRIVRPIQTVVRSEAPAWRTHRGFRYYRNRNGRCGIRNNQPHPTSTIS